MEITLFEAAQRKTKRESYNQGTTSSPKFPADQKFNFNINYRNNSSFPLWLHPYFAFGTWVGGVFIPYSPQRDLITYVPTWEDDMGYAFDGEWMRLGGAGMARAARNMFIDFPDDNLYTERAYLKVPASGVKSTGFDNVLVGHNARSIVAPYPPISTKEYLVLQSTAIGETWYYEPRDIFEALNLDIAIKSKVYECEYYEAANGEIHGRLVDTGIEVWGGLLGCAQIAHAWGSWSEYHAGHYIYYTWVMMLGEDIPFNAWGWSF